MWRQYYQAMYHAARVAEIHRQQAAQRTGDAHPMTHAFWHWALVAVAILAILLLFGVRFAH